MTLAFLTVRNGAAVVMCGLCLAGLVAARLIGFSNRALVPLALGVIAILWAVWVAEPIDSDAMSAVAHTAGGGLVGWALAEFLRERIEAPSWAVIAVAAVFALTVLWELGEWAGDVVFTTDLDPNSVDSILDIFFGTLGGAAAISLAWLIGGRRHHG